MDLKCECGGSLEPTMLQDFDFSVYAGLPVRVTRAPGLKCSKCGGETLEGEVIDELLEKLSIAMIREEHRLAPPEMKFLRKRMQLTQAKLAQRMGIVRETLADWERGASAISPQYDFMLRGIFVWV
jgi:DNA-binding transcriptional regulator YiaG